MNQLYCILRTRNYLPGLGPAAARENCRMRVAGVGRIVSPYVSKLEWKLYEWAIQSWLKTARVSILDAHSAILKEEWQPCELNHFT